MNDRAPVGRSPKFLRVAPGERRGAMAVLIAMLLVVFLAAVAFSVDVAYMQLTKTRLRTATDAAARAGGEALARLQDVPAARQAAKDLAAANLVAGEPLILGDGDIVFGSSDRDENGAWTFTAGGEPVNALRVYGRRTADSASGAVGLFFGRIFGVSTFEPTQTASVVRFDRDICLVVDRSGSMKWRIDSNGYPTGCGECDPPHSTDSRWAALAVAVGAFVDALATTPHTEYVGLASFASNNTLCGITNTESDIDQPLTEDTTRIGTAMGLISSTPFWGQTNIAAGIDDGVAALTDPSTSRPYARKTMVVLTDGLANEGRSPAAAAADAAAYKIVIHTITFGDVADQAEMQNVAAATGGKHYHAPDAEALVDIFREIALTMLVVLTE